MNKGKEEKKDKSILNGRKGIKNLNDQRSSLKLKTSIKNGLRNETLLKENHLEIAYMNEYFTAEQFLDFVRREIDRVNREISSDKSKPDTRIFDFSEKLGPNAIPVDLVFKFKVRLRKNDWM